MTFAAGFNGGTYLQMSKTLASMPDFPLKIITTKGSRENIELLATDKADLAFTQLDVFIEALKSNKEYPYRMKILVPVYYEELHIVSTRSIKKVKDLSGKRLSIGPDGSGIQQTAKIVLKALKIQYEESTIDKNTTKVALAKLLEGKLDAVFIVAGAPVKILELLEGNDADYVKLLPLTVNHFEKISNKSSAYRYSHIIENTYPWQTERVSTLSVTSAIVTRSNMPDERAKNFAENLEQNKTELYLNHIKWHEFRVKRIRKVMRNNKKYFHRAIIKKYAN